MEEPHNQTSAQNYTEPPVLGYENIFLICHCLISSVALPLICVAIYGLHSLAKNNHVAPVYIMNLFISDLIQVLAKVIWNVMIHLRVKFLQHMFFIYIFSVVLNVCFMVCLSAERYTMIAHPVWYRQMLKMKISVFVSVTVWILSLIFYIILTITSIYTYPVLIIIFLVILLTPYPLVMFFFVGTWRALSRTSVPRKDQRQIVATLALVLFVYSILFLPYVIVEIIKFSDVYIDPDSLNTWGFLLEVSSGILMSLNPLFDFLLYVFMRKDAKDIFSAIFSCFYKRHEENTVQ